MFDEGAALVKDDGVCKSPAIPRRFLSHLCQIVAILCQLRDEFAQSISVVYGDECATAVGCNEIDGIGIVIAEDRGAADQGFYKVARRLRRDVCEDQCVCCLEAFEHLRVADGEAWNMHDSIELQTLRFCPGFFQHCSRAKPCRFELRAKISSGGEGSQPFQWRLHGVEATSVAELQDLRRADVCELVSQRCVVYQVAGFGVDIVDEVVFSTPRRVGAEAVVTMPQAEGAMLDDVAVVSLHERSLDRDLHAA